MPALKATCLKKHGLNTTEQDVQLKIPALTARLALSCIASVMMNAPHDVESLRRGSQALCRLSVWDDPGPVSYCGFRAHSSRAPFTRSGLKNCTWLHLLHTAIMKKLLLYCAGDRYCGAVSPSA